MILKVISGGQTGVDRAALDAAIELKIPYGGWCPKGRLAELGAKIPDKYLLKETASSNCSVRTKLNIRDSEGTLILLSDRTMKVIDGTVLTIEQVKQQQKPYLIVDLSKKWDIASIVDWIRQNNIEILNVAGPRESNIPGIYLLSLKFLRTLFMMVGV